MKNSHHLSLTGNQLKLIAAFAMTADHVGLLLLDNSFILRAIGRIAFPLFAYLIAEGFVYTKNRSRYFFTLLFSGILFQTFYTLFTYDLYMNIFLTFSLSVIAVFAADKLKKHPGINNFLLMLIILCLIFIITKIM